jgi:hypothetical protein
LIITVGKRSDGREIQQCHTFRTMTEARAKQNEIRQLGIAGLWSNVTT